MRKSTQISQEEEEEGTKNKKKKNKKQKTEKKEKKKIKKKKKNKSGGKTKRALAALWPGSSSPSWGGLSPRTSEVERVSPAERSLGFTNRDCPQDSL